MNAGIGVVAGGSVAKIDGCVTGVTLGLAFRLPYTIIMISIYCIIGMNIRPAETGSWQLLILVVVHRNEEIGEQPV